MCSGPAVFPQVSNITEGRGGESLSIAVTQAKNNPFLVNRARASFPSPVQHSVCSFLCSNRENAKDVPTVAALRRLQRPPGELGPFGSTRASAHPAQLILHILTTASPLVLSAIRKQFAGREMTQPPLPNKTKTNSISIW